MLRCKAQRSETGGRSEGHDSSHLCILSVANNTVPPGHGEAARVPDQVVIGPRHVGVRIPRERAVQVMKDGCLVPIHVISPEPRARLSEK